MFEKFKIKKEIAKCKKEIEQLEQKRIRSQAALVTAILKNDTPDDSDVDYFNSYTTKIEEARDRMIELERTLERA